MQLLIGAHSADSRVKLVIKRTPFQGRLHKLYLLLQDGALTLITLNIVAECLCASWF